MTKEDRAVIATGEARDVIVAMNKSDLVAHGNRGATHGYASIATSALTGEGIAELRVAIVRTVAGERGGLRESGMLTNMRQHQAVERAMGALDAARAAVDASIPHEMLLLDLYEALRALDALTGATTTEDVLRLIFSTFCIGK
jgi:tRNA modification GTPase